ncbi:MAG: hypothetical protein BMS9Abin33_0595 [Gammaproteobacteria bacterium]|nr:MAG: hypothetical protein BMS9Abin33_0595 [Gammaproteobacteria bacterium]
MRHTTKTNRLFTTLSATGLILVFLFSSKAVLSAQYTPERFTDSARDSNPQRVALLVNQEKRPQYRPRDQRLNEKDTTGWAIYIDNDLLAPGGSDRDYTGGLSLTLSGKRATNFWLSADPVLHWIDRRLKLVNDDALTLHSFETGLTIFTPEDTRATHALNDDRPYSSLVYLSNTREQVNPAARTSLITTLAVGVLGLGIGEEVQNGIHRAVGSDETNGWDNQISDGGEFTFRYGVASQAIKASQYQSGGVDYEVTTTSKISVGYLTDVAWGVSGRLGRLRSPWWTFNPQLNEYSEKSSPLPNTAKATDEFYIWTGFNLRLRAYNALLQGQFRDSAVTYNRDELQYVIGELWVGVTREFASGLRLSYFVRGQTSEIKEGSGSRNPVWGGLIISHAL